MSSQSVVTVRNDPFARQSLERVCITNTNGQQSCAWCGQKPARLYVYTNRRDDSPRRHTRWSVTELPFCNLDYFDSYHI